MRDVAAYSRGLLMSGKRELYLEGADCPGMMESLAKTIEDCDREIAGWTSRMCRTKLFIMVVHGETYIDVRDE